MPIMKKTKATSRKKSSPSTESPMPVISKVCGTCKHAKIIGESKGVFCFRYPPQVRDFAASAKRWIRGGYPPVDLRAPACGEWEGGSPSEWRWPKDPTAEMETK